MNGKYRLEQLLGTGSMAEVYLGSAVGVEGFARRVAVKRMLPGPSSDPQFARMFTAEARITSRLVHPNIVSVLDFDRDAEGQLFLVMELVEGRDLGSLLATGRLPPDVVVYIVIEMLRGLGYAHGATVGGGNGLVHRDLSPANVLLSWQGAVKIADFGLAKVRGAAESSSSVMLKGSPAYMSPEQASGDHLDGRSDLFAVGVLMWEMLVGRRLFVAPDVRGTLEAVLFTPIPRPRQHRSDVPRELDRIVMTLLDRKLARRYESAESAIMELAAYARDLGASRERLTAILGERFRGSASLREEPAGDAGSPELRTRRRQARGLAAGVGLLAFAGCLTAYAASWCGHVQTAKLATFATPTDASPVADATQLDATIFPINLFVDLRNLRHCVVYEAELDRTLGCAEIDAPFRGWMADEHARLQLDLAGHTMTAYEPEIFDQGCKHRLVDLYRSYPDCRDVPKHRGLDLHDVSPKCAAYMQQLDRLSACAQLGANAAQFSIRIDRMLERFTRLRKLEIDVTPILQAVELKCEEEHKGYMELERVMGC